MILPSTYLTNCLYTKNQHSRRAVSCLHVCAFPGCQHQRILCWHKLRRRIGPSYRTQMDTSFNYNTVSLHKTL